MASSSKPAGESLLCCSVVNLGFLWATEGWDFLFCHLADISLRISFIKQAFHEKNLKMLNMHFYSIPYNVFKISDCASFCEKGFFLKRLVSLMHQCSLLLLSVYSNQIILDFYEHFCQIYISIYSLLAGQKKSFFKVKKLFNLMSYILGKDFTLILTQEIKSLFFYR